MTEKRYKRVFEDRNNLAIFDEQEQYSDKGSLYLTGDGIVDLLNEQDKRIKELETVVQDILYETRFTVGKDCGEVCVFVSPQVYKRLTELLKEKIKW